MEKILLLFILLVFLSLPLVYALEIECYDDGSLKVDGLMKKWPLFAKEKSSKGDYFEVPGEYFYNEKDKIYTFYSDEALFISQTGKKYSLQASKYKYTFSCPAFKFSCRIFNISIDYCYNRNNTLTSKFMVYNFHFNRTSVLRFSQPFMLKYEAITEDNRELVHGPEVYSPEFKNLNFTLRKLNAGNKYLFQWPTTLKIKNLRIRYDQCRQKRYNFYTSLPCTQAAACTIDKDCFEDESCENKLCQKLDCGECQYLQNRQCLDYTCCFEEDCLPDETCSDHTCQKLNCSFDEQLAVHACLKLECFEDEYIFNHTCLKLACLDWETALNHTCVPLTCKRFEKAVRHQCINYFHYYYNKLFKP